jgi:hypothetical protein
MQSESIHMYSKPSARVVEIECCNVKGRDWRAILCKFWSNVLFVVLIFSCDSHPNNSSEPHKAVVPYQWVHRETHCHLSNRALGHVEARLLAYSPLLQPCTVRELLGIHLAIRSQERNTKANWSLLILT